MALRVKAIADEALHYVRIVGKCEDETLRKDVLELHKNDSSGCSFVAVIPILPSCTKYDLIASIQMTIKNVFKGEGLFPTWLTMKWIDGAGIVDEDVTVVGGTLV